jgi:hypothetical protein
VVYDPKGQPEVPDLMFKRLHYLPQSTAGTAKAVCIWSVDKPSDDSFAPLVVVAVKGTACVLDAMATLNGKNKSTVGFLVGFILCYLVSCSQPTPELKPIPIAERASDTRPRRIREQCDSYS